MRGFRQPASVGRVDYPIAGSNPARFHPVSSSNASCWCLGVAPLGVLIAHQNKRSGGNPGEGTQTSASGVTARKDGTTKGTNMVTSSNLFFTLLLVMFIGLKLANVITWPWIWVLSPVWIPLAILVVVGIVATSILMLEHLWEKKK